MYPTFATSDAAKEAARRLSRDTGDVYCIMPWNGAWIAYALGYGPVAPVDHEEEED